MCVIELELRPCEGGSAAGNGERGKDTDHPIRFRDIYIYVLYNVFCCVDDSIFLRWVKKGDGGGCLGCGAWSSSITIRIEIVEQPLNGRPIKDAQIEIKCACRHFVASGFGDHLDDMLDLSVILERHDFVLKTLQNGHVIGLELDVGRRLLCGIGSSDGVDNSGG